MGTATSMSKLPMVCSFGFRWSGPTGERRGSLRWWMDERFAWMRVVYWSSHGLLPTRWTGNDSSPKFSARRITSLRADP